MRGDPPGKLEIWEERPGKAAMGPGALHGCSSSRGCGPAIGVTF